ncbi:MAG: hypothetical protein AB7S74_17410 [Hyphomicrobium sp.]
MGLVELEMLRLLVNRLENEINSERAAAVAAADPPGSTRSVQDADKFNCIKEDLRRLNAQGDRVEARYDGLDRRMTQMSIRIDELEMRVVQRSQMFELQVQHLRESLPAVIEESMREALQSSPK